MTAHSRRRTAHAAHLGLAALVLALPATGSAQLTLTDALREADQHAFANRMAGAATESDRARARLPLKGILPSARLDAGVMRTTDPIGAFGTTLRQRLVTPAAFDPAKLNNPDAITNVLAGVVLEVPLVNGDAWTGWKAARAAADATAASQEWTAITTRSQVVRAYYGAIVAAEKATMLQQAEQAANAAVRQVQLMVQQGLVTKADALQASVRGADVRAQLLAAQLDAQTARQQLGLLLGRQDGSSPELPSTLPPDDAVRAIAVPDTLPMETTSATTTVRADVRAATAGLAAARADKQRATTTLVPRVNGFARYDWNDPTALYGGQKNWTVGVMASWSLFGGGSELADIAGTSARLASARAGHAAATAQQQIDAESTRRGIAVALQRLDLAVQSAEQAQEAHRLVDKRYVGGLATVAELLAAESAATGAALMRVAARYAVIDAVAAHRRAIGADPGALRALESAR